MSPELLEDGLKILKTAPLGVVGDFRYVLTAMNAGRDESRKVAHDLLGRPVQEINELLLPIGPNREGVDESERRFFCRNDRHE